ncbi:MAG: coproporphyrinogen III oxidase family protein [Treponema sp.]|nr:coproporphyrinogen III oxidase family protein [Treponema sp.]
MFSERYRSHHDAEHRLGAALGSRSAPAPWEEVEKKLKAPPEGKPRGVYIHVPHCDRICTFCNLNRRDRKNADLDAYTGYIIEEIKTFGAYPYIRDQPFEVVYFGGGTPTVLNLKQLGRILRALRDHLPLKPDCEITLESTQHNLPPARAAALGSEGVTRFSIGIQTFSDRGRKILGRTYGGKRAVDELAALRAAFSGVLGIDLIYSYPEQTLEEAAFDAETCAALGVDSASFYSLMIQGSSALAQSIEAGELTFHRDIDFDRERHHLIYRALRNAGFSLLELSKLARPNRDAYRYIHIRYENGDLLPLGSGAGGNLAGFPIFSMAPGRRFVSAPNPEYEKYYRILGLLQFGRYDAAEIARYLGAGAEARIREKIAEYLDRGFLETGEDGSCRLSSEGIFWGNNIAVDMLQAVIPARMVETVGLRS